MIPEQTIILLSGIPATGKSHFANYLKSKRGFTHYDMEAHQSEWPRPDLKDLWDTDRAAFVKATLKRHKRVVLDWGFPVSCISRVKELQEQGVKLIWFDGDITCARTVFVKRGGKGNVATFDTQIRAIQQADYPRNLNNCLVVRALSASGLFLEDDRIESIVFP